MKGSAMLRSGRVDLPAFATCASKPPTDFVAGTDGAFLARITIASADSLLLTFTHSSHPLCAELLVDPEVLATTATWVAAAAAARVWA